MRNVKERLFMSAQDWGSIEEVPPDEIDLQMIREIQSDPDCQTFA